MLSLILTTATLPLFLGPFLDPEDYPAAAVAQQRSALILTEVIVSPNGRPLNCRVVISGGAEFDTLTCASTMKRARYKPARDDQGKPAFGFTRAFSAWTPSAPPKMPLQPSDVRLTIRPVAGIKLPTQVTVILSIDADGRPISCVRAPILREPGLLKISCDQAMRLPPFPPINFDGQRVPSVRAAIIAFTADQAGK